jgi:hypothetical protein
MAGHHVASQVSFLAVLLFLLFFCFGFLHWFPALVVVCGVLVCVYNSRLCMLLVVHRWQAYIVIRHCGAVMLVVFGAATRAWPDAAGHLK